MAAKWWPEALLYTVDITNRLPMVRLKMKSPYEWLYGKRPNVLAFRIWGLTCYAHVPKTKRKNATLGYKELAHVYHKSETTIGNWIRVYDDTGTIERAQSKTAKKLTAAHRAWLCNFYDKHPLSYLDDAQTAFVQAYHITISTSSIWRIIHEFGLIWKVLERCTMHIKERDVSRFNDELFYINWSHYNLIILDQARVFVLAFIGVSGLIDYFDTQGTFDPGEFTSIHMHPEIIHSFRNIGIAPILLPAYCPFFNPIEYLFGYVKKPFQRHYNESSGRDLLPFAVQTFRRFENFNMAHLLERHQEEDAPVSEAFRLLQLYDEKTGRTLTQEVIDHSSSELKIAFVSISTAYRDFFKIRREKEGESTDQPENFHHFFDHVLMEPRCRAAWSIFVRAWSSHA
ncbi:hypothetical protein PHMEG_0005607 [Phytophthora megakarya]|uniref:Tc1-like transposase DDE domain-containing protein n=1 Tax=Phytophthora megakarya TaxID=4795 RepID=A0A225WQX2_9STRA|nr:hypothetical protein PHMEG_0005607 [Phytophthora megakarya]